MKTYEEQKEYNKRVSDEADRMEAAVYLFNSAVSTLEENGWFHAPFGDESSWETVDHPWYLWRNDSLPDGECGTFSIDAALRTEHNRRYELRKNGK